MTKRSPKVQEKRDAKRRKIVEVASYRFNQKGFHGISISKLSREVGLTTTGLYHYVDNKETLLYYCYLQTLDEMEAIVSRANAQQADPQTRFFGVLLDYYSIWSEVASGDHPSLALLKDLESLSGPHRAELWERYRSALAQVSQIYREGVDAGQFVDVEPEYAALLMVSIIAWLPVVLGLRPTDERLGESYRATINMLKRGLSSDKRTDHELIEARTQDVISELLARLETEETQDKIYRRSTRAFNQFGFTATKLDRIALSVGLTKGAIYHYIDSKEELLIRCLERTSAIKRFITDTARRNADNGMQALMITARTLSRLQQLDIGPLASSQLIAQLNPWNTSQALDVWNSDRSALIELIQMGRDDGSIQADANEPIVDAMSAMIDYLPSSAQILGETEAINALNRSWQLIELGLCR